MKRIGLGVFLLLLCGFLFAGGAADKSASSETAAENQKIEFTWLHHLEEQGKQDWVNHCVTEYMAQHPDVRINVEMIPNDNYLTMLKTRIASDDAPMIFDLDRINTLAFVKAGHLADVSDVDGLTKNFNSDILSQGQVNGVQYGVPLDVSGYGVFYNKEIFDRYNLKIPTTADEFRKVCDTLQANGIVPLGAPFAESWCQKHFCYAYIYINCVEKNRDWFTQKMSLQSNFSNDEAFKKSIATMVSYKKYWGNDPFSTCWNDVLSGIAAGKIAMTINGSWTIAGILSINPEASVRTFAFPVSDDSAQTQMRIEPGNNFCVYNTANKQVLSAAKGFFAYLCSVESGEYYAKAANGLTGCTVHVDSLPAVKDITNYTGSQVYNMIAISEFNAEYLTAFNDITQKYLMQKTFDMDGYTKELDNSFKAIKQ
jgi:raffinose/stachyose/melibiose transport system substrate-binding protein